MLEKVSPHDLRWSKSECFILSLCWFILSLTCLCCTMFDPSYTVQIISFEGILISYYGDVVAGLLPTQHLLDQMSNGCKFQRKTTVINLKIITLHVDNLFPMTGSLSSSTVTFYANRTLARIHFFFLNHCTQLYRGTFCAEFACSSCVCPVLFLLIHVHRQ